MASIIGLFNTSYRKKKKEKTQKAAKVKRRAMANLEWILVEFLMELPEENYTAMYQS